MLERERQLKRGKERERVARLGCSSMHSVSTDRTEKEENKGREREREGTVGRRNFCEDVSCHGAGRGA